MGYIYAKCWLTNKSGGRAAIKRPFTIAQIEIAVGEAIKENVNATKSVLTEAICERVNATCDVYCAVNTLKTSTDDETVDQIVFNLFETSGAHECRWLLWVDLTPKSENVVVIPETSIQEFVLCSESSSERVTSLNEYLEKLLKKIQEQEKKGKSSVYLTIKD